MTRATAMVLAGLSAATLAACGSSGSKTVSKAQIISKGDAICSRLNATAPTLPKSLNPTTATPAQLKSLAPALTKTSQIISSEVSQVGALGTPSSDATLFKQILAEGRTSATDFQAAAAAAAKGDRAGFLSAFARLQAVPSHGKQFGFHSCDVQ